MLIFSISFSFISEVLSYSFIWSTFLSLFILPHFLFCFCELDGTGTSLKLEKVVLCMVNFYVDCVPGDFGWNYGRWVPEHHSEPALVGWPQLKWVWAWWSWGSLCRGCPDGAGGAQASISWEVPECWARGEPFKPTGAKVVWSWSALECFASVPPWCNG